MTTHNVYIYEATEGDVVVYRVWPPVIVAKQNDSVDVVNMVDDEDADVSFPPGSLATAGVKSKALKNNKVTVNAPNPTKGVYPYKVKLQGKRAKGNSDPLIIIE